MKTGRTILIVEDEKKIAQLLADYLEKSGYVVVVHQRGDTVVPYVRNKAPDLILLDLMLPGMDGVEVCRRIRVSSAVPIIMLTARVEEIDRLLGLEIGADDYICKPFSPREVVARVKAVMRRVYPVEEGKIFRVGRIELNEEAHKVTVRGHELKLTPIEFGLLKVMLARPNRVFPRSELTGLIQGYDFDGYDRTVDSHIKNLRKKIASVLPDDEIISSVYGVGYKLNVGEE